MSRRLLTIFVVAVLMLVVAAPTRAMPRPASSLDDARAAYEEAQAEATSAAARHEEALSRFYEVDNEIGRLEEAIAVAEARAEELLVVARTRAREAYMGERLDISDTLESNDVLDAARKTEFLDTLNAEDDAKLEDLRALNEDLARKREELEAARVEQQGAVSALEAEQTEFESKAEAARQLFVELEEQERLEQELRAREAAERTAAEERASRAAASAPASTTSSPGGTFNIVCPVPGSSFVDSWGAPRGTGPHQAVDMMAPIGTPNYAVVSGTAAPSNMGIGGYGVTLSGDDGNVYQYIHLSPGTGVSGHVSQGEFIGSGGDSGNAAGAPHTHFEIHPGGGAAVNPYPHVVGIC